MDSSHYQTHFDRISGTDTSMMIALEPTHGLDAVKDDEYLRKFIRDMGNSEVPMFLRFANEMNDPSNPWHKDGPEKYKEKFRLVAKNDKFKDVAKGQWYSDAVIWVAEKDIVSGYSNGNFGTNDKVTREHIALMFYNYSKMKGEDVENNLDLSNFKDSREISTRAEVSTMIMNLMNR